MADLYIYCSSRRFKHNVGPFDPHLPLCQTKFHECQLLAPGDADMNGAAFDSLWRAVLCLVLGV